jgi:hypothetical protein
VDTQSSTRFTTPALAAFAAGRAQEPIGHLPNGRPVFPIAGGAEDALPAEQTNALPTAEELQAMTDEQVQETLEQALSEANDLRGRADSLTDAELDRLDALADFAGENGAVDGEVVRREQVAQERAARVEAAGGRLERPAADEAPSDEAPADAVPADAPADEAAPADAAPEAVAAGGAPVRRPAPRPAQRRIPTPAAPSQSQGFSLVAAADAGFPAGSDLSSMAQVAEGFAKRSQGFPLNTRSPQAGVRLQHSVASLRRDFNVQADGLWYGNPDYKTTQELLVAASKESRLEGGSLVAAGGWCAPSTTMYGLTSMETLDGIIDLPTVGVDRGGINFTPGPDFSDIFTDAGFFQTEAQAIAGTTKACTEVDCPDFDEVRLDAVGHCVKAPLLTRAAYNEAIQRWLEGTVIAVQHKVAARLIASMRTALGSVIAPTLTGTPVAWGLLTAIELVIEGQRQAFRLSESESLEVILPRWSLVALRADFANRVGAGIQRITTQVIKDHLADRGANVQFVLNYQELATPLAPVAFPATLEAMIYPAGTFVKGVADVISLDTVYDTADLQTNVYTAAFVEDGVLLAKMQHGGARVQVPVNVSGIVGAAQMDDNWGTAQVESVGV